MPARTVLALALACSGAAPHVPAADFVRTRAHGVVQDDTATLVESLCGTDLQRRLAAHRRLLAQKPKDAIPLLLRSLPKSPLASQSLGWSLLSSYPPDQRSPAARALLASPAPFLALAAAVWLWRFEDHATLAPKIAQALARGRSPEERAQMLLHLGDVRDAGVDAAVRALVTPDAGVPLLDAAFHHLLRVADPDAGAVAKTLLAAPGLPADERLIAGAFLMACGDPDAAEPFAAALPQASLQVLHRLPRLLAHARRLGDAATLALVRVLESESAAPRRAAVARILVKHPSAKALPALRRLLEGEDETLMRAAFEALAGANALATADLQQLLGGRPRVALLAAESLRRQDDPSGLPRVLELLAEPGLHRVEAMRVLGGFRVKEAVPPLLRGLDDADPSVRSLAQTGLQFVLASLFPYRRISVQATGYASDAPEAERRAGAAQIAAWWRTASAGLH